MGWILKWKWSGDGTRDKKRIYEDLDRFHGQNVKIDRVGFWVEAKELGDDEVKEKFRGQSSRRAVK